MSDKTGIERMLAEAESKKQEQENTQGRAIVEILGAKKGKKKRNRKGEGGIKDTVIKMVPYMTPMMAEHCLEKAGIDGDEQFDINNEEMVQKVIQAALLCKNMVADLENLETIPGYIIYEEFKEEVKEDILQVNKNETRPELIPTETPKDASKETPEAAA